VVPPLTKSGLRWKLADIVPRSGEMFEGDGHPLHMPRCGRFMRHRHEKCRVGYLEIVD
jgi:hypothetical protein